MWLPNVFRLGPHIPEGLLVASHPRPAVLRGRPGTSGQKGQEGGEKLEGLVVQQTWWRTASCAAFRSQQPEKRETNGTQGWPHHAVPWSHPVTQDSGNSGVFLRPRRQLRLKAQSTLATAGFRSVHGWFPVNRTGTEHSRIHAAGKLQASPGAVMHSLTWVLALR